jgi:hypothetical protein
MLSISNSRWYCLTSAFLGQDECVELCKDIIQEEKLVVMFVVAWSPARRFDA